MKRNSLLVCLFSLFLITGCSKLPDMQNEMQISKKNALIVCLDEANISKDEIENESIKEKDGFHIEFDYHGKHYVYHVQNNGLIASRKVTKLKEVKEEVKKEKEKEVKEPELSALEKDIIAASLSNAQVSEADVQNIRIVHNSDNTYSVRFELAGVGTIHTLANPDGHLISSTVEE